MPFDIAPRFSHTPLHLDTEVYNKGKHLGKGFSAAPTPFSFIEVVLVHTVRCISTIRKS